MSASDHAIQGLYAVTDARWPRPVALESAVHQALQGGVRIIQYRDKSNDHERREREAAALVRLCQAANACLIVNDDVALARRVGADGVHLGGQDQAVAEARKQLGEHAIIGASCYNDLARAKAVLKAGADYLAFGSIYPSSTKPHAPRAPLSIFAEARALTDRPLVAIGGIQVDNIAAVIAAGADAVAVVDALFGHEAIQTQAQALIAAANGQ